MYLSFLPIPQLCLLALVLLGWSAAGLLSKGFFWLGSSWFSCPQWQACSGFWQDYECLLSANHSCHKTDKNGQIHLQWIYKAQRIRLAFKVSIWLSILCFGFPWLLQNHCVLLLLTLTAQTFCVVLEVISGEWGLGMVFRSKVVCFYRIDYLSV